LKDTDTHLAINIKLLHMGKIQTYRTAHSYGKDP
jgi:hypothetical protein